MNKQKIFFRIFWITALAVIFLYLAYQAFVPSGKISYEHSLNGYDFFISNLSPAQRTDDKRFGRIIGDPVYLSFRAPRVFHKAKLEIEYKEAPGFSAGVIEAGLLMDKNLWQYDLKPLENLALDELFKKYFVVHDGDLTLLQKEKTFNSVNEFLNNLPPREFIYLYNYRLDKDFVLEGYLPQKNISALDLNFRGDYQFFTYIDDERLNFEFAVETELSGLDEVKNDIELRLYFKDQVIASAHPDENNILKINEASLPQGVYKVEIRAPKNIITKTMKTTQSKIAFLNKVEIANGFNAQIYTDAQELKLAATYPGEGKTVSQNNDVLKLAEPFLQYNFKTSVKSDIIKINGGGVVIAGDGVFALSDELFFNPQFKKFSADTRGAEYVLTRYSPPRQNEGAKMAVVEFDLQSAYFEKESLFFKSDPTRIYNLVLSIPSLNKAGAGDFVEIEKVKIDFEGETVRELLKRIF